MTQRVARSPTFSLVEASGENLLYDTTSHNVVYLDQPASVIWFLCDGTRTLAEIADVIGEAYPESRASIADDVRRTVTELAAKGALILSAT